MNLAVERFVTVGETIADDNPEIKQDMYDACKEARTAGKILIHNIHLGVLAARNTHINQISLSFYYVVRIGLSIERLCEIVANDPTLAHESTLSDRNAMVRAGRALLSSVTRVLLLADIVVVKQLLLTKDKVKQYEQYHSIKTGMESQPNLICMLSCKTQ